MPPQADASRARIEGRGSGRFAVHGEMTLNTVPALWDQGREHLAVAGDLVLDLAGVTRCDSAGAALVLHWATSTRFEGRAFQVQELPQQMRAILKVSDLERVLSGEVDGS